jgi:hypothetical protein
MVSEWTVYLAVSEWIWSVVWMLSGLVIATSHPPWDDEHSHSIAFLADGRSNENTVPCNINLVKRLRRQMSCNWEHSMFPTPLYTYVHGSFQWRKETNPTSVTLCSFRNITRYTRCLCQESKIGNHVSQYYYFTALSLVAGSYKIVINIRWGRSQWPRGLRRRSVAACLLGLRGMEVCLLWVLCVVR